MRTTPVAAAVGLFVGRSLPASVVSPLVDRDDGHWLRELIDSAPVIDGVRTVHVPAGIYRVPNVSIVARGVRFIGA